MKANYPLCECPNKSPQCCGGVGPAVFSLKRNGKRMKLCTKCDFGEDNHKKVLAWVKKAPANILIDFDPFGAFCLAWMMKDKK